MWNKTLLLRKCKSLNNAYEIIKRYSVIASVLEKARVGELAEVKGWVRNLRIQKDLIFADVSDGSCAKKLQIVIPKCLRTESLSYGASVHITGTLRESPRGQLELHAEGVQVVGGCDVSKGYPFNPRTAHPPEYVRQFLHLRPRTNYAAAVLRLRSALASHIHRYLMSQHYLNVNTPILTSNDCEGGGECFKVRPDSPTTVRAMMQEGRDEDTVYFGTKSFLTVSGQLHLEAVCRGMGNVYTLGPTFRAENSRSRLHLSEFYMLEAELAFCDRLSMLQSTVEELLKYLFVEIRNSNEADLHLLDKDSKLPEWIDKKFVTLTYDEAKQIVASKGITDTEEGINKQQELALVQHCAAPTFIVRWPKHMKAFYMQECSDDDSKVEAFDLLTPITGEVVGGSLREHSYDKLQSKLPSEQLSWYLELRKFGNVPTGGFGLGLERLLQVMCGIDNIKDTLPFPRWPHNCHM